MKKDESLKNLIEAIKQNKPITCKGKKIKVEPKLTKRNFFDSLNTISEDAEYFLYFGYSDLSIALYPTMRNLKDAGEVTYKELSELRFDNIDFTNNRILINERFGHSNKSIEVTKKIYEEILNK